MLCREIVCEEPRNGTIREYTCRVTIYKWTKKLVGRRYYRRTGFFLTRFLCHRILQIRERRECMYCQVRKLSFFSRKLYFRQRQGFISVTIFRQRTWRRRSKTFRKYRRTLSTLSQVRGCRAQTEQIRSVFSLSVPVESGKNII